MSLCCHYAECHYACHYAECHYVECNYVKCRYVECRYVKLGCKTRRSENTPAYFPTITSQKVFTTSATDFAVGQVEGRVEKHPGNDVIKRLFSVADVPGK